MHYKVVPPGSFQFGEAPVTEIKLSGRGLVGSDLGSFIKRAGYKMADDVRRIKFAKGEVPIHVIAIGATEFYGPNRNGDGFDEDVCRAYHNTFVKHARMYRNHQNKDQSKSYGVIKYSCYNEPMHRIELVVALNGTKEAAERNKGLLADKEMEKLAAGRDIAVSMACRVPYDICSSCGNKARTRSEYCRGTDEGGHCKEGGCANHLGRVNENGHHVHVKNTLPDFFDLSDVLKGADRIAYVIGEIEKAAAAGGTVLGGSELAERMGVTAPFELFLDHVPSAKVRGLMKLAKELSDVEDGMQGLCQVCGAFTPEVQPPVSLDGLSSYELKSAALKALANRGAVLPIRDYARLFDKTAQVSAASVRLPGVYGRLVSNPEKLEVTLSGKQVLASARPAPEVEKWAAAHAETYSLAEKDVRKRGWLATIRGVETSVTKLASEGDDEFAEEYALYKLAALNEIRNVSSNFMLTCDLAIRQNHVS